MSQREKERKELILLEKKLLFFVPVRSLPLRDCSFVSLR